jgi:hypothetical protein
MHCLKEINLNQFGYKKKTSCKHSYFLVNETINYYKQNGSKLYAVFLDASKAFDKLWRDGLFFKLMNKIPNEVWRLLYTYYRLSKIVVKYELKMSSLNDITEGVKQGGILSPYLFNFFVNELLIECTNLNIWASINNLNLSIIAYCDDIVLLSPSAGHCQKLLDKCAAYSTRWKIEFNPKKSAVLVLQKNKIVDKPKFVLNGFEIPHVQNVEYLGMPIGDYDYVMKYLEDKWKKVEKNFYSLYGLGCKLKSAAPELVGYLYKQFCQSAFRYHLDLLYISESKIKEFEIRQNLMLKRAIGIRKFGRFSPVLEAIKVESIEQIYMKHKIFFIKQLMNHRMCYNLLRFLHSDYEHFDQKNSSFCKQLNNLEKKLHIDVMDFNPKTSIAVIEHTLRVENRGLVDSVKMVIEQIRKEMQTNSNSNHYFYLFKILNDLLKVDFYA